MIVERILKTRQNCSLQSVHIVGHTDSSGPAGYNLNLSSRRANDVREELISQGVNPAIIYSEGYGETEPFVQTGDGVKEQLNRRTELVVVFNSGKPESESLPVQPRIESPVMLGEPSEGESRRPVPNGASNAETSSPVSRSEKRAASLEGKVCWGGTQDIRPYSEGAVACLLSDSVAGTDGKFNIHICSVANDQFYWKEFPEKSCVPRLPAKE